MIHGTPVVLDVIGAAPLIGRPGGRAQYGQKGAHFYLCGGRVELLDGQWVCMPAGGNPVVRVAVEGGPEIVL